jgi:hypothetical protein
MRGNRVHPKYRLKLSYIRNETTRKLEAIRFVAISPQKRLSSKDECYFEATMVYDIGLPCPDSSRPMSIYEARRYIAEHASCMFPDSVNLCVGLCVGNENKLVRFRWPVSRPTFRRDSKKKSCL